MPAYNAASHVSEAIESALAQTYPDVEIIVVDDGSTDRTLEVLRSFADRIVLLQQPNRGPSAARNAALERATGSLIALLDADDVWKPHRLERMISELERDRELGFLTSDAHIVYGDRMSEDTYYADYLPADWRFHSDDQPYWIIQYNFVFTMTVVRRELFERHGRFDESLRTCEDWELWARFITEGERVGLVPEPLGFYRVREGSLTRDAGALLSDAAVMLDRALQRPSVQRIPGTVGSLLYARGMEALGQNRFHDAAVLLRGARRDPTLSMNRRLRALVIATSPRIGSRLRTIVVETKRRVRR